MCISTSSFAVLMNGGPSTFFNAYRGLRQGDPLSPLLFLTVMEAFSRLMERAEELNLLKGVEVGRGKERLRISHLFFVDDALIFCEPFINAILYLRCILLWFQMVSGLKINIKKTEVVRIGDRRDEENLAMVLGCKTTTLYQILGFTSGPNSKM